MLLDGTGLQLDAIEPNESEHHERRAQLTEAPLYLVKLVSVE